jgi:hypothetical protein
LILLALAAAQGADPAAQAVELAAAPAGTGFAISLRNVGTETITAIVLRTASGGFSVMDLRYSPIPPGGSLGQPSPGSLIVSTRPTVAAVILQGGKVVGSAVGNVAAGASTARVDFVQAVFDSRAAEAAEWDKLAKALDAADPAASFLSLCDGLNPASGIHPAAYARAAQLRTELADLPRDAAVRSLRSWLTERVAAAHRDERRAN